VKVTTTRLPGVLVVEPQVFGDARGWFYESWNQQRYAEHGIGPTFVQSNLSRSARDVLRGLHYQWPNPQGKLVSVLDGEVWDVAVDVRRGSPTYAQWEACVLSAQNRRQFWIPEGFAHGFVVLSEHATFAYLCTRAYDRAADAGVRWDDPELAIDWPVRAPTLSDKDARAPLLAEIAPERLPQLRSGADPS
jgi:dTDP-4-dehydrorhamnose 3,5-epimerase